MRCRCSRGGNRFGSPPSCNVAGSPDDRGFRPTEEANTWLTLSCLFTAPRAHLPAATPTDRAERAERASLTVKTLHLSSLSVGVALATYLHVQA